MLKTIFIISPLYVTLFWLVVLNTNVDRNTQPRTFLGKFMFFAFVVYLSHFLYFASLPNLYVWTDALYQYASLMVFPLYNIYFRLLTIDQQFSFRKHFKFILPSTFLLILYIIGILISPIEEYKMWAFDKTIPSGSFGIVWLNQIYLLMGITFIGQLILVVISNFQLIKRYRSKAAQYYSDIQDVGTINVRLLNASMILTGIVSVITAILGRNFFEKNIVLLGIASIVFSILLFTIGWLGNRQKSINPAYEQIDSSKKEDYNDSLGVGNKENLLIKILTLFEKDKIYLRSCITIQDVATIIGTNRSYISSAINEHSHQNFCSFVNEYRLHEIEKLLKTNKDIQVSQLAEQAGFGSVDSMKRAIRVKFNLSFNEWKDEICNNSQLSNINKI